MDARVEPRREAAMSRTTCGFADDNSNNGSLDSATGGSEPPMDSCELWGLVTRAAEVNKAAHGASNPWWRRELFKEKDRLVSAAIIAAGPGRLWASYQFRENGPGFLVLVAFLVPPCGRRALHVPFNGLSQEAQAFITSRFGRPPEGL